MPGDTARDCTVIMLDGTSFSVSIKPKLLVSELTEMACSHCKINNERKYFGLKVPYESYDNWLEPERPVLDPSQDLPKPPHPLVLNLAIMFYVEDYRLLTDHVTVEQYYFQAKQAISGRKLECNNQTLFTLIGCMLQEMHGNYRNDKEAIENLKSLMTLPRKVVNELGSATCEKEVLHYYRNLRGHSRGDAIVRFLEMVQSLPMYGVHYFSVKDKKECPKWLGIGLDCVMQFNFEDKQSPTRKWPWKQLKNIMYKEKKFIMEVMENHPQLKHTISSPGMMEFSTSSSSAVPKKPSQQGNPADSVTILTWYANPKLILSLWRMAKVQHKFSKAKLVSSEALDPAELIKRLNKLLVAPSNLRRSPSESQNSISSSGSSNMVSAEAQVVAKTAQSHMYTALTAKRNVLVEDLEAKVKRYKELQVKEMQITRIPPEGLSEDIISSLVNKRPNQFKFSPLVLENGDLMGGEILQLEKQIEVQSAIVKANKRLVSESNDSRLKKTRKKDLKKQEEKLKDLEAQLAAMKGKGGAQNSTFFIGPPINMRYTGGVSGDIIPRTAPPVRKGIPANRGTVDDSVISDLIFDTNSRETPQLARKTQTLNKSTPNLNKSSPNLSELSFSPTPPIHHRDNFGSSVSSISSKTKSVGSLPSQSDADSQSLCGGRDKSHSPFSDELSPSSGVPAIHLSPSATSNVFDRPVSPSRPLPIDSSPSKSRLGGMTANGMKQSDMFAAVMNEYKDKSAPSSVVNANGSPTPSRKKIHHYESIWDYPSAEDRQKNKVDLPMQTRQRHQSPRHEPQRNEHQRHEHQRHEHQRHEPQMSTRVDRIDQPLSKYDQHLMKFDQFVSKQTQMRHDQRTAIHMPRQDQQMSRHDQFMPRLDHPGSRHDQHMSRHHDYPGSRHEQFISRQDFGMPQHPQDTHRNAPLPSRTFSSVPPGHHQLPTRYVSENRLMLPNHGEVESSTLERRRRKSSQPEHIHAVHINAMRSNGYTPGRRPNPPTIEENPIEMMSSSYHQGHIGGTTGTLVRSNTRYEPSGRFDPWDYAASALPYSLQHGRQRSEPEHLFEHAKSEIVDFQHHVNPSNNSYNFHEQNSYNFHDPGTFEEGTLV